MKLKSGLCWQFSTRLVYVEHINLKSYIRSRLEPRLVDESQETREAYVAARRDEYRDRVKRNRERAFGEAWIAAGVE